MTYDKLLEREAGMIENVQKIKSGVPRKIYIG
jgi:predicted transcriptional regulator